MRTKAVLGMAIVMIAVCCLNAQNTIQIDGYVCDSLSKEPLVAVAVAIEGSTVGTATNAEGRFTLKIKPESGTQLVISSVGYRTARLPLRQVSGNMTVRLVPLEYELGEITVRPKRYKRKGNPAVDFILEMLKRRDENEPLKNEYYSYDVFEQRVISFESKQRPATSATPQSDKKPRTPFKDYVDTVSLPGVALLPAYSEELTEQYYYRKTPRAEKRLLTGFRRGGLIDLIASEEGVKDYIDEVAQDVNVFQDNIELFLHRFVSPLSSIGQYYYKYYITDTVEVDGERYINILFSPFNRESFGFVGSLQVSIDGLYFVKRLEMKTPHGINLNFIDALSIEQEYSRAQNGSRQLMKNVVGVKLNVMSGLPKAYGLRTAVYTNHSFAECTNGDVYTESAPLIETDSVHLREAAYWNAARSQASPELRDPKTDSLMHLLRQRSFFLGLERIANIFMNGYVQTAPKKEDSYFEIGHVNTFISGNTLEGTRLKFGGNTTVNLSPHFFIDAHAAYGLRDRKLKPHVFAEYSFNRKKNFRNEFPYNYIRAEYKYDINQIGQRYLYTNADNVFLMFKRRDNNLLTYEQKIQLSYYHESYGGFAYNINLRRLREWSTRYVPFIEQSVDGSLREVGYYTSSQAELHLRYAPGEKFYQSRNARYPIHLDAPILTLTHTVARKGLFGSDHNYNRTEAGVRKRFWLSPFGYADILVQCGKVWDKVPYPLLLIPNANLSYTIQEETFALLDPMEFIHDRYVSWEATWKFKGALFNRIPLLKRLHLREIIGFRGWYGSLSDRNNPLKTDAELFRLPENTTFMSKKPYMEMNVGLGNILKIIRIDYVWRLSYRNRQDVPDYGFRLKLEFSY